MIIALQISAVVVFAAVNVLVCFCLLLAGWADGEMGRFDEFKFAPEEPVITNE